MSALARCVKRNLLGYPHVRVLTYTVLAENQECKASRGVQCDPENVNIVYGVQLASEIKRFGEKREIETRKTKRISTTSVQSTAYLESFMPVNNTFIRLSDFVNPFKNPTNDQGTEMNYKQYFSAVDLLGKSGIRVLNISDVQSPIVGLPPLEAISGLTPLRQIDAGGPQPFQSPVYCMDEKSNPPSSKPSEEDRGDKAGAEELEAIKEYSINAIPNFFVRTYYVSPYNDDNIVFENNYFEKQVVVRGLNAYYMELMKLRFKLRLTFSFLKTKVLKVTVHPEESCVRAHWRLFTIGQLEIFKFWKFYKKDQREDNMEWYDGISTFYVNKKGKIIKHVIDRTIPVQQKEKKLNIKIAGVPG